MAFYSETADKELFENLDGPKKLSKSKRLNIETIKYYVRFELAASRAFKEIFPEINIRYCHFHFGQSLFRKVHIYTYYQN
jgi:hypothetical protein